MGNRTFCVPGHALNENQSKSDEAMGLPSKLQNFLHLQMLHF